jgi:hypothetical protein
MEHAMRVTTEVKVLQTDGRRDEAEGVRGEHRLLWLRPQPLSGCAGRSHVVGGVVLEVQHRLAFGLRLGRRLDGAYERGVLGKRNAVAPHDNVTLCKAGRGREVDVVHTRE